LSRNAIRTSNWRSPTFAYYLFHPSQRLTSTSLQAVIDTLRKDRTPDPA